MVKKKKTKKGARKQICFQICMAGACSGDRNSKIWGWGPQGPPFSAAGDGWDGARAPGWEDADREPWTAPQTVGASCAQESWRFLPGGVLGGKEEEKAGEEAEIFSSAFCCIFAP